MTDAYGREITEGTLGWNTPPPILTPSPMPTHFVQVGNTQLYVSKPLHENTVWDDDMRHHHTTISPGPLPSLAALVEPHYHVYESMQEGNTHEIIVPEPMTVVQHATPWPTAGPQTQIIYEPDPTCPYLDYSGVANLVHLNTTLVVINVFIIIFLWMQITRVITKNKSGG